MDNQEDLEEISPTEIVQTEDSSTATVGNEIVSSQETDSNTKLEPNVTVKCILIPLDQVITFAKPLKTTIEELSLQIANDLRFNSEYLQIVNSSNKDILSPYVTLNDLGVEANGIVQLEIISVDPENHPLREYKPKEDFFSSPDVITVRVDLENSQYKEIVVEIERSNIKKPYIGGYRNKKTGFQFHNAATQTRKPRKPDNGIKKYCRDTQTVVSNHIKLQTYNDMSTQMTKPGVFISVIDDKLVQPKQYETAEEKEKKLVEKVIIIQKYLRRWLAKREFNKTKDAYLKRIEWEKEQELLRIQEIEKRRQMDINRRLNPKTKADFEILYSSLEKWRNEELLRINATKAGAARKAALAMLVDQETELIATIERYKIEAAKENREKEIQLLLEKMSSPKKWKYVDGTTTEVDTPYNIRAKELKDIYNSLNMKYLTQDERLDVLLTLKHTVKEHDCKLTQEIVALIDREADLLLRGIKEENLIGLRQRIASLYLQYIKTPQFNPAVAKHLKVPLNITDTTNDTYYCTTCEKYLPSTEFQISSTNSKIGKCRNCKHLENLAIKRVDFTKFKYMLLKIQNDEELYGQDSRICYLLTPKDLQYVFENIWASQSVLSSVSGVYNLHFVRWIKDEEWSPWNCVLLTLEEAAAHLKLNELEANYGETFIRKVKQKHMVAKSYFSKLPGIAEHIRRLESRGDIGFPPLTGVKIA